MAKEQLPSMLVAGLFGNPVKISGASSAGFLFKKLRTMPGLSLRHLGRLSHCHVTVFTK